MNFFPLCTASVWPTISGTTVERRDQVLMTFFSPPRFMTSIFSRSGTSTKGPFFSDLLISVASYQLPVTRFQLSTSKLLLSPLNDESVSPLRIARFVALRGHPPWRHRVPATGRLALTAAERVIHRVHRHATHVRPDAEPAAAAGLADRDILMIEIADLPHRRVTLDVDLANLSGRQLDRRVLAF